MSAKTASSWGHQVHAMSDDDIRYYDGHGWTCEARGCTEPARYYCTYRYVTGREGRVTTARRTRCATHAEQFARKYGIDVEPVPHE